MKVHGMLILDKPRGLSSNAAMQRARRLVNADKAGHGGTLDPLATGLLPVLFGEACKLASTQLDGDKQYEAVVRLGERTTTDDAEGEIIERSGVDVGLGEIDAVLASFTGVQVQVPPVFSAIKVGGRPLYRAARAGEVIDVPPRTVTIDRIDRIGWRSPDLHLRIDCSKGTYIRALARDIGARLGCGAHLAALRRTRTGAWRMDRAVTLDELEADSPDSRQHRLVSLEQLVQHWPSVEVDAAAAERFSRGLAVFAHRAPAQDPPSPDEAPPMRDPVPDDEPEPQDPDPDEPAVDDPPLNDPVDTPPPAPVQEPPASMKSGTPVNGVPSSPGSIAVVCAGRLIGLARPDDPAAFLRPITPVRIHPTRVIVA